MTDIEATVDAALAQVQRLNEVVAHGSIVVQKEFLRGFVAGITIAPSKDRGVITWYGLPASLMFSGRTGAELEKMQAWSPSSPFRIPSETGFKSRWTATAAAILTWRRKAPMDLVPSEAPHAGSHGAIGEDCPQ